MYVGVIPVVSALLMLFGGIPHVRGGDPQFVNECLLNVLYSPCTWG